MTRGKPCTPVLPAYTSQPTTDSLRFAGTSSCITNLTLLASSDYSIPLYRSVMGKVCALCLNLVGSLAPRYCSCAPRTESHRLPLPAATDNGAFSCKKSSSSARVAHPQEATELRAPSLHAHFLQLQAAPRGLLSGPWGRVNMNSIPKWHCQQKGGGERQQLLTGWPPSISLSNLWTKGWEAEQQ